MRSQIDHVKLRHWFARWRAIGAIAIAVLLVGACASPDEPRAITAAGSLSKAAEEIDLTGAHLDKRKFLIATSMLGRSLEEDLDLLRKMTGYSFDPKPEQGSFAQGEKRYRQTAPLFKTTPLLINGTFWYRTIGDNRYESSIGFVFNRKTVCITENDLESIFGRPTRVTYAGGTRVGTGPSHIWDVIYVFPSGARGMFAFSTATCANDFAHSAVRIEKR